MNKFEKPYYTVDPTIYCSGSILVNDVPVIDWYGIETKEGGFGGGIPINHVLLQTGIYKVVGKMYPRHGNKTLTEEEILYIDFYCAEGIVGKTKETRISFHPKLESPWDGLSENINYPYFEIATEIEVELPFVLDGWQNSVDLLKIDEKELFNKVLAYYRQIHAILKEHNAVKFLEISQEKMKLQETAFYFDEARKESFREGALALFNQNLEVEPIIEGELKLEVMGYGKLVRLIKKDGSQPLQFKSPDTKKQSNVELEVKLHMRSIEKGFSII